MAVLAVTKKRGRCVSTYGRYKFVSKRTPHQVSLRMPPSLCPPMTYTLGEKALMAAGTSRTTWWPARPDQAAGEAALAFHADISVLPLPASTMPPPPFVFFSFFSSERLIDCVCARRWLLRSDLCCNVNFPS